MISSQDDCEGSGYCDCSQVTQPGDLVLTGTQVLVIEDTTYAHQGNICLQDNARLLIDNGTLDFQLEHHCQYYVYLLDSASLEITDGSIDSPYGHVLSIEDTASVTLTRAAATMTEFHTLNNASVHVSESHVGHPVVASPHLAHYVPTDLATWVFTDSTVGEITLYFGGWSVAEVRSIRPGLFSDWDLQRDNTLVGVPYNISLRNTTVQNWDVETTISATLTLVDSEILGFGVTDSVSVTVRDSELHSAVLQFWNPPAPQVFIEGLHPGYIEQATVQGEPAFSLTVENSNVNGWAVRTSSVDLTVSDSVLGVLRLGGDGQTVVTSSTMCVFWAWGYHDTITFTDSVIQDWYETRWCDFWMKGTVTIEGGTIIQEANGPWTDGVIHREYPVEVTDWQGNPLADVALTLRDNMNAVVWAGASGAQGTATFTLTFTETNYFNTWTLSAAVSDPPVTVPVEIRSDTPILVFPPVAVTDTIIDGPTSGYLWTEYAFTATTSPISATAPITYVWEATGQPVVTHTSELSDTMSFIWATGGQQVITVTAANAWNTVTDTHTVSILHVSPTGMIVNGPTSGLAETGYTFTATVSPITTTLPVTYVWKATGQTTVTHTDGLSDTVSFTWSTEGQKVITVTATNAGNTVTATHVVNLDERDALVTLYHSTDGPNWTRQDGWLGASSPCDWYGLSCSHGHVVELNLADNQLSGTIPAQLGNLTALQELNLRSNQLSGSIPPELGNLSQLRHLFLNGNQLSGSIPPQLGNLTALQELDLGSNQLSGSIPPELGNLSQLRMLYLYINQLSGNIPSQLGNPTGLWYLALNDNQLSGSIPAELGNLSELWTLELPNNQLTGHIPPELGNLNALGGLALENNRLSGSIPPQLGNMTSLLNLNIRGNALEGEVPANIADLVNLQPSDRTDFGYNRLGASDPTVVAFLNEKDPDWAETQTVPPVDVQVASVSSNIVELSWTPISYTSDSGYYEVGYATTSGGPYAVHGTTNDKSAAGYLADNLSLDTSYYFVVRTFTPAHGQQQNDLWSGHSQEVSATTPTTATVPLSPGWNLISLPLEPDNPVPDTVLASIAGQYDRVHAYDGCDPADPWKQYVPGGGDNDLTAMDVRYGYWVHATSSVTLTITGTRPTTTNIPLCPGLNLIGWPSRQVVALPDALSSIADDYDLVYGYDPSDATDPWKQFDPGAPPFVNTLTQMEPGKGYWIRVTEDCTLTISN